MTDTPDNAGAALLPAGLRDVLPPDAAFEAAVAQRLLAIFARSGYEQVNPPLVEFEESFLSGAGAGLARETFRVMDPVSQRMMAVRSDMTPQVARIATTRLRGSPRPLRLAYAGQVLRVKGSQLRPQRQFRQAGCELIGTDAVAADAEVLLLAVEALAELGVAGITVDLNLPTLVPAVCARLGLPAPALARLKQALDHKDAAAVAAAAGEHGGLLLALLEAGGPAEAAVERLAALDLPPEGAAARVQLAALLPRLRAEAPGLTLTVDAVEHRGFEYHSGTSFAIFARGVRGELGRGGRYLAGEGAGEPAVGFTLFLDTLQRALPAPPPAERLFLPCGTPAAVRRRLQAEGWTTVAGLDAAAEPRAEARRLGCSHALIEGGIRVLEKD